jgi:hypothetical protein
MKPSRSLERSLRPESATDHAMRAVRFSFMKTDLNGEPPRLARLLLDEALVTRPSAPPRGPRPTGHPVAVGLPWADGDRMTRLPPQPPDNLDQAEASILEPEVPAGGK